MIADALVKGQDIQIEEEKLKDPQELDAVLKWAIANNYRMYFIQMYVGSFPLSASRGMYILEPQE